MKTLESWVLRLSDSDACWYGFNWMRPAKTMRLGCGRILGSSILLGLPGCLLGLGVIYWYLGRVTGREILVLSSLALAVELALNLLCAHYWNRRAASLDCRPD